MAVYFGESIVSSSESMGDSIDAFLFNIRALVDWMILVRDYAFPLSDIFLFAIVNNFYLLISESCGCLLGGLSGAPFHAS